MIRSIGESRPRVHPTAFVSEAAYVVGGVEIGPEASIWPGAVIRADNATIVVGRGTVIQERAVLHGGGEGTGLRYREGQEPEGRSGIFRVGKGVLVGRSVVLHCGHVGDYSYIGSNAVVLDGADLGDHCRVASHSVVPPRERVPAGSFLTGIPALTVTAEPLSEARRREMEGEAERLRRRWAAHKDGLALPPEAVLREGTMIRAIGSKAPHLHPTAWVSEAGYVAGDVVLGEHSSVWPGAVVLGDVARVTIGAYCDVQDNAVVHAEEALTIGDHVSIAHGTNVHARRIGSHVLVANNSTLSEGVEVGDDCIIAAGSLVPPGTKIPSGSMVIGVPAVILPLEEGRRQRLAQTGVGYSERAQVMKAAGL